jgi:hypothetical protein
MTGDPLAARAWPLPAYTELNSNSKEIALVAPHGGPLMSVRRPC